MDTTLGLIVFGTVALIAVLYKCRLRIRFTRDRGVEIQIGQDTKRDRS